MINQGNQIKQVIEKDQNFQNKNLDLQILNNNQFQICLNSKLEELKLEALITMTLEKFSLYCIQVQKYLKMLNIEQLPSAFKLEIKNDSVTLETMKHPIIASPNQRLILNPQFINQIYFFENLTNGKKEAFLSQFDEIFFEEVLLILLFWKILSDLRYISEDFYDIYIYPNRCNFYIIKNNTTPYFFNEQLKRLNVLINTQTLLNIINDLQLNQEYQIQLFDIHPPDKIVNKGIIIPIKNITNQETLSIEQDQEIQKYLKFGQVTITSKPYYFIFSTLCRQEKNDEINHIINFNTLGYPKCQKCNISIHPDDFDTFYTKKDLLDIWEKGQLLIKQQAKFVSPIFLLGKQKFQIKKDQNQQNLLIVFYKNQAEDLIINDNQQQEIHQFENIQDKETLEIVYKRLQVVQPFLNYELNAPDSKLQYEIIEDLESNDENKINYDEYYKLQNKK